MLNHLLLYSKAETVASLQRTDQNDGMLSFQYLGTGECF